MRSVTVAPRRSRFRAVSAAAASSASAPSEPCTSASSGTGEDERGGTVGGGDQRGRLPLFQRGAEGGGERCRQRVAEQGGAATAGEAGGDGVVLGDVRVARGRRRPGRLGDGQRHDRAVERAAQEHAGDVAVRGGGEQLPGLDRAEPVPVEHPHDPDGPRAALGPPAQRGTEHGGARRRRDVASGTEVTPIRVATPPDSSPAGGTGQQPGSRAAR